MKYIKYFESDKDYLNGKFYPGGVDGAHVGDFVILNPETAPDWCENLFGKIGEIVDIDEDAPGNCFKIYIEGFDRVNSDQPRFWFFDYELLHYGTLDEMMVFINAKKYNL